MKDIVEITQEYGLQLERIGKLYRAFCPFHEDTGKPNFTVYPETNSWFCFANCGGGDVIQFVSRIENISRTEAKLKLSDINVDLEELRQKVDGVSTEIEDISYNDQLNITVSQLFQSYLRKNPKKVLQVFSLMEEFDKQLLIPIDFQKMQIVLTDLKQKLEVCE